VSIKGYKPHIFLPQLNSSSWEENENNNKREINTQRVHEKHAAVNMMNDL